MQVPFVVLTLGFILSSAQSDSITCNQPPSVQFGSVTTPILDEYPVGTNLTYSCNFGYVPDSISRTTQCIFYGRSKADWTELEMSCIPRSCGDPGYVNNGRRVGALFTFPNSIEFKCDEGYKIRGTGKRYCQASGTWSGKLPRCEAVYCNEPKDPQNGRVTYSSLEYGSELQYECDRGFKPKHKNPILCTEEGTWSETMECVEAACDIPEAPEHGSVDLINAGQNPRAGSIAIFSCKGDRMPDGPTNSKCLATGQWTFPAPKCLEPCNVPFVLNGNIGRYVSRGYGKSMIFKKIDVGTRLENKEKLFLHCSKGYDPLGSDNWQEVVICDKGVWSDKPYCEPASCRSYAPLSDNLEIVESSGKHESTVLYKCLPDFKMVKNEDVSCIFGEWKGSPPTCKDTRCYTNLLNFHGLNAGGQTTYSNGEYFEVKCETGYQLTKKSNGRLKCEEGVWKGSMPPCTAANCNDPPPSINHGRLETFSTTHSSTVKYVCDDSYILTGNYEVQCRFGEWKGKTPVCQDSRCFLKDLNLQTGVSSETESVTRSGDELRTRCIAGYTPGGNAPLCLNGIWTKNRESPCKESDCEVTRIANGRLKERKLGSRYFEWSSFSFVRDLYYENVPFGSTMSPNSVLYVDCIHGYTFHGSGYNTLPVSCSLGRWTPDPVCLITGNTYYTTTAAPRSTENPRTHKEEPELIAEKVVTPKSSPDSTTVSKTKFTTLVDLESGDNNLEVENPVEKDECSCEITIDDENLVAYVDDKQLKIHDRVPNGSVVKFRCNDVGFRHLTGQKEMTCKNCQAWHSSDFPICPQPKQGDAVIVFEENVNVTLDGTLEIKKGEQIQLICIAFEEAEYPTWIVPSVSRTRISEQRVPRDVDVLYVTYLNIDNPDLEDDGSYTCTVGNFRPTVIHVNVIDSSVRCQKFAEDDEIEIEYDKERQVKSKAMFTCRKSGKMIVGNRVLTCLSNGQWSDPSPQCKNITCKELEQTDLMEISYTEDQKIGSFASFHCFAPGKRSGVARVRCLENGEWSDSIPTCTTPPCPTEKLFSKLPPGVKPQMDEVTDEEMPYNSTVRLTCEEGKSLIGDLFAKCGKDGEWENRTMQCINGCRKIDIPHGSNIIVKPEREGYRIGHSVTFSCPPGKKLNGELVMIMCLSTGWSETNLPKCEDTKEN